MKPLNRIIACLLVLPTIWLFLPTAALAAGQTLLASADVNTITVHEPKVKASSEVAVTLEQSPRGKKKKTNWLLIGLAAAVVIGLAAVASGSGGGDGGGDPGNEPSEEEEGDVTVGW